MTYLIVLFAITLVYFASAERLVTYLRLIGAHGLLLCGIAMFELREVNTLNLIFIVSETIAFKAFLIPYLLNRIIMASGVTKVHRQAIPAFYPLIFSVLALLIYHDRTGITLEATWKYVFICSVGIALANLGILFLGFIYGREDATSLSFTSLAVIINQADPMYLKIAFLLVLIGFSTKMGLSPMHTVTIDAHSVAPPPVSALISTTLMNVGFLAIFRVYTLFSSSTILPFMNSVLILAGVFSLLIAAGFMLKAKQLKRMLAYSSLENMGLVAIAIGVGGTGYYAALLLLVLHSLAKSSLFYQMGQLSRVLHTFKLDDCGRYMKLYPAGAMVLILGMICILAIPPSGLFITEFMISNGLVNNGQWFVLIVSIVLLCFVVYAMTTRFMHIIFSNPRQEVDLMEPGKVSPVETISQFVFLGLVMLIFFYQPRFLADLINQSIELLPK